VTPPEFSDSQPTSILEGTDSIINRELGLGRGGPALTWAEPESFATNNQRAVYGILRNPRYR
jgi:hypothetical protein